jgi:hypothetical protein
MTDLIKFIAQIYRKFDFIIFAFSLYFYFIFAYQQ